MILKKMLAASMLLLGSVGAAHAIPYTWEDPIDFNPDLKLSNGGSFSYTHDIRDDGFDPFKDSLYDYQLWVDLYDDGDQEGEKVRIDVPDLFGLADRTYFNLSGSEFGGWSLLGYLQLAFTGQYDVTITSRSGDFYLGASQLTAWGNEVDPETEVPEPATLGLMGLGLLAGAAARRRKKT